TSTIQDDIKTVDFNLACKVTFSEFPIFHPYPGTELGEYCKEKKMFNSSYDSLHMSYMHISPLTSFTAEDKVIQQNLGELATVVVAFPFLRNIILKHMIYWPHNFLFFLLYYLVKAYLVTFKIYPFRYNLKTLYQMAVKSIRLEKFKHSNESMKRKN
ncbi:MAG: hypothetical protein PHF84_09185, partial [bacterium]|nr:hypothetical protein [bacterium]